MPTRALFWFFLARASLKTMMIAGCLTGVTLVAMFGPIRPWDLFISVGLTSGLGFALFVLALLQGFWSAYQSGTKIWLNHTLVATNDPGFTKAILGVALFGVWDAAVAGVICLGLVHQPQGSMLGAFVVLAILFTLGLAWLLVRGFWAVAARSFAAGASECSLMMKWEMPNAEKLRVLAAIAEENEPEKAG